MIKQKRNYFKDGTYKTNVRVMMSYRPGPKQPPKQKTIRNFGYLEDYENQEAFWKMVHEEDEKIKKGHGDDIIAVLPKNLNNNSETNKTYNYGYRFIESILKSLRIDKFFDKVDFKGKYSLYDVFSFLVYERILDPCSKRSTIQKIDKFFEKSFDFELYDIYRALDVFSDVSVELQTHINNEIKKLVGRDHSYAFYDVTNFYFEKDFNGEKGTYPQKGVSKEHQLTPIVQFGLFMDSNNIPIAMKAYPGNTSDSLTLQPSLNDIKKEYDLGRLIIVADKGLNSTSNIDFITRNGDGYVVSQILRGPKGKRFHDIIFDNNGWEGSSDFKYKIFEEEYSSKINSKKSVKRKRKVLIYWSKEDAEYARKKREEKIRRSELELLNNVYDIGHINPSENKNIITDHYVKETGELADASIKKVNYDKFKEDEKFDGFFCIITSELNYDYKKILEVYHHLSYIEESFRITKSDLETRPIFVTKDKHIDGHLLTCFVSLIVIRLLQYKMGEQKISAERLKSVLTLCTCEKMNDLLIHLDSVSGQYDFKKITSNDLKEYLSLKLNKNEDQIRNDFINITNCFNINLDYTYLKINEFNRELKRIKF